MDIIANLIEMATLSDKIHASVERDDDIDTNDWDRLEDLIDAYRGWQRMRGYIPTHVKVEDTWLAHYEIIANAQWLFDNAA